MPTTPGATGSRNRRTTNADSDTRRRLIEATAEVMRTEGYAAATSRRVAAAAGVKQALVYYYFPTMDDLFVEVMRAGADVALERMRATLTAEDPLQALWDINSESQWTILSTEFTALANHRKAIRAELKAYAERVRDIETAAVTMVLRAHDIDLERYPPVAISMLITQTARSLCNEDAVGVTQGHTELRAFAQRLLAQLDTST
ncbi:TetR/AcrR family transcriptional regulator [Mycobacterium sp. PS03-16]|uniref:TetR/AcrR family transcriptional regulator n=1 Tax=Mycobacterium sp. PS03-16 TaxID=2559611 RepID=UPI0010749E24|nr:TetR/AcrR family transcriptional regulator [Mycobacterium sp. PS03-16]TFV56595.1 TetR/AcrR family transcriptional regulator [Mycobacterium sp. PS03-16]